MTLPDFIIIGAAKAGTTSLHAMLDRHPDIFMPRQKEPEFFARDDLYSKGLDSYAENFAGAKPGQVVGEASTLYSLSPLFDQTAARIKEHLPQAKLIYIMREPVARSYSFYIQLVKNYQNISGDQVVHRRFEDFIDAEAHAKAAPRDKALSVANAHLPDVPELCLAGSDYVHQIKAYLEHFPREQMLFLKFEDFVTDRPATLRQITDFLGVAPLAAEVFEDRAVTQNISREHFEALGSQQAVESLKSRAGPLWALRQLLPVALRSRLRDRVGAKAAPADNTRPDLMTAVTRDRLQARFHAQRKELSALTGLSFDSWD